MRTRWISLIFLLSPVLGSCGGSQAGTERAPELPPAEPPGVPYEISAENPLQLDRTPEPTEMPSTTEFRATPLSEASTQKASTQITPPSRIMVTIMNDETIPTPMSGNLRDLIESSKEDLARRLGTVAEEINVLRIEKAEWPDTSLGCATPGLTRRPIAVSGYLIVLSTMEREYVYHTNRDNGIVFCPKG